MLTAYQVEKNIADCKRVIASSPVGSVERKRTYSRLHYYTTKTPKTARIDHATPAHKKVVAPIAQHEVFSYPRKLDKTTRVLAVVAGLCFIVLVIRNIFF